MKKRTAELILKDPEKFAHHDRVFLNNPVVMQGMGLAPLWVSDLVRGGVGTVITHLLN